jgi:hypothetical protein
MVERRCSSRRIDLALGPCAKHLHRLHTANTARASGDQGCSLVQPSVELPEQLRHRKPPDLGGALSLEVPDTGQADRRRTL